MPISSHSWRLLALGASLTIPLVAAHGQAPSAGASAPVDTAATIAAMKSALRNMVVFQEAYYADNSTYTTSPVLLGVAKPGDATVPGVRYKPSDRPMPEGVSAQVIFAGGRGWTGIATSRALRGMSCVIFVGNAEELPKLPTTRGERKTAAREGEPTCDWR